VPVHAKDDDDEHYCNDFIDARRGLCTVDCADETKQPVCVLVIIMLCAFAFYVCDVL